MDWAVAGLAALSVGFAGAAWSDRARRRLVARAVGAVTPAGSRGAGGGLAGDATSALYSSRWVRAVAGAGGAMAGRALAGVPGLVAGTAVGWLGPALVARRREASRRAATEAQLVDAVRAIGAALRAGLSLPGAISFAAAEVPAPLGPVLRRVVERHGLGVPLDASVAEWADADGGADARLVASVLELHHRTGGDAPVVLEQVARTLADRRAARAEVRALTAQARLSGAILGMLPIGFFLFLSATSREDMAAAYRSPAGLAAIVTGVLLQGLAFLWIRRLLRVEI